MNIQYDEGVEISTYRNSTMSEFKQFYTWENLKKIFRGEADKNFMCENLLIFPVGVTVEQVKNLKLNKSI